METLFPPHTLRNIKVVCVPPDLSVRASVGHGTLEIPHAHPAGHTGSCVCVCCIILCSLCKSKRLGACVCVSAGCVGVWTCPVSDMCVHASILSHGTHPSIALTLCQCVVYNGGVCSIHIGMGACM